MRPSPPGSHVAVPPCMSVSSSPLPIGTLVPWDHPHSPVKTMSLITSHSECWASGLHHVGLGDTFQPTVIPKSNPQG